MGPAVWQCPIFCLAAVLSATCAAHGHVVSATISRQVTMADRERRAATRRRPSMPGAVRRACDAMRANPGGNLSLAQLADIAGTPVRTLQRQFRIFMGRSPHEVLREIRYATARRELLRGLPNAKVTDIAARCGLHHFSRFSAEYRRRYGENPSQTLWRRAAVPADPAPRSPTVISHGERPAITVSPVDAGPKDAAIARGIGGALREALSGAGLRVIEQSFYAPYDLRAAYRRDGRLGRLTYRLIEVKSGRCLWAHHCDGSADDAFALEERIANMVAGAIQPPLRAAEIARASRFHGTDPNAYDLTLRALPHAIALDAEANARALDLIDRALVVHSDHALAVALAAWCHAQRVVYQFTESPNEERSLALRLARRAAGLGGDATVFAVIGNALSTIRELEASALAVQKALMLDGSSAWAWSRSAWNEMYAGETDSAIERFAIALELAPHDPLAFNCFFGLGVAHFHAGRYQDATRWLKRAIAEHPSAVWVHRVLCPAYVLLGQKPEAHRSRAALQRAYRSLTIAGVTAVLPGPQAFRDRVADSLASLGIPSGA
jgi:AraC-like DNA-binding protein/tetratricopeptide (TPR) repeat protein